MKRVFITLLASASLASSSIAMTVVGGPILAPTVWTAAGSPYMVVSSILIGNGATLTINPGVDVIVSPNLSINVGSPQFGTGGLIARGTSNQPIRFTGALGTPGSWNDLFFDDMSLDASFDMANQYVSGSFLEYCTIEFAGGTGMGGLRLSKAGPYLRHVTVRQNTSDGFVAALTSSTPPISLRIEECRFDNNSFRGLEIIGGIGHSIIDSAATENGERGFFVQSAENLEFLRNEATDNSKGGLYAASCQNSVISECNISDNTGNEGGGGIQLSSCPNSEVSNCTIENNITSSFAGGAYFETCAGSNFSSNTIAKNRSSGSGGGIYMGSCQNSVLATNTFLQNETTGNSGGHLAVVSSSGSAISDSSFRRGKSSSGGGAILVSSSSSLSIDHCVIEDNETAQNGGGIFISGSSSGLLVNNTRVSRNRASGGGGGLYFGGNSNSHTGIITSSTITSNDANGDGGGIWIQNYTLAIDDSTIALNTSGNYGGAICAASMSRVDIAGTPTNFNTLACNSAVTGGDNVANFNPADSSGIGNIPAANVCWGTTDFLTILNSNYDFFTNSSLAVVAWTSTAGGPLACDPLYDIGQGSLLDGPTLTGSGTLVPLTSAMIDLVDATPNSTILVIAGVSVFNADFLGTTIVPSFNILVTLPTSATGTLSLPFTWPAGAPMGTKFYVQVVNPTTAAPNGVATLSNTLLLVQP